MTSYYIRRTWAPGDRPRQRLTALVAGPFPSRSKAAEFSRHRFYGGQNHDLFRLKTGEVAAWLDILPTSRVKRLIERDLPYIEEVSA